MAGESMTLAELAWYLRRDRRELDRLAARGKIPCRRVSGQWRFERAEIQHWLETQLEGLSNGELVALEGSQGQPREPEPLLVHPLLSEKTIAVPLLAKTKSSVVRALVETADRSGEVYQPDVIRDAVMTRERLHTTALDWGVALPHWRRPLAKTVGRSLIAYGRTTSGIPFGAPRGCLTDIFFLVLCRDDRTHLRVLARLARLLQLKGFLDRLREASDAAQTYRLIESSEEALVNP